jgi:nitrous oxidase accessory protein NosD
MNAQTLMRGAAAVAAAAAAVLGFQTAAQAHSAPSVVYVTPNPSSTPAAAQPDGGRLTHVCPDMGVHSIQRGVNLVATGGKVVVCPGTYRESVNISKRLTLQGLRGAVVDATRQSYGIGIGADHVTVTGMTVHNAGNGLVPPAQAQAACGTGPTTPRCSGIVTFAMAGGPPVAGNYDTIVGNVTTHNLAFGLDIVSTHDTLIKDNKADDNGVVGMNVVDDLGLPVMHNRIIGNDTSDNTTGCGIAMAGHTGAGVIGNWVEGNTANRNGLGNGGAGILLATGVPGAVVEGNTLVGNHVSRNGHSGIEVHMHIPGLSANGNRIIGNYVGTNNTLGDFGDTHTTGIYLGSNSPMSIVVKDNHISCDVIGIFKAGPHVRAVRSGNTFSHVRHPFVSISTLA